MARADARRVALADAKFRLARRVQALGHKVGVDIRQYAPDVSSGPLLPRLLARHGVDLVLDVGANSGQFAKQLRVDGYTGRIVSFEPVSSVFAQLERHAAGDSAWTAVNVAIGDAAGTAQINVAGNDSLSSSLLGMEEAHVRAAPDSAIVATEEVTVARLDEAAAPHVDGAAAVMLKLDVQGYERAVIEGAAGVLPRVTVLEAELSLVPLYDGQPLLRDMLDLLDSHGFDLVGVEPMMVDPETGHHLQLDGWFVRRANASITSDGTPRSANSTPK